MSGTLYRASRKRWETRKCVSACSALTGCGLYPLNWAHSVESTGVNSLLALAGYRCWRPTVGGVQINTPREGFPLKLKPLLTIAAVSAAVYIAMQHVTTKRR
jgi:hypothetical protein